VIRALALAALALAACKKSEEPRDTRPAPIGEAERERGVKACSAYVERLCACARDKTELARTCQQASSRVDTLEGLLETSDQDRVANDVLAVQVQARKIIANCMEDMSELDRKGCP
jgi:hypothetical protein